MKKIVIVSGISGTGKSTFVKKIVTECENELVLVKSITDRKARGENDYYKFVSTEEFYKMKMSNGFLETNMYGGNGHNYGTPLQEVENIWKNKKTPLLEIDVTGRKQIMKYAMKNECKVISIFLYANPAVIYQRLYDRNSDTINEIINRLMTGLDEIKQANDYDGYIENVSFAIAAKQFHETVNGSKKHCRTEDWLRSYEKELRVYIDELVNTE